ncbi:MAG TPA: hypothetical protein VF572_02440 [Candidatus Saccharimonadales bacterium]|jgi:hypothetical protein
MAGNTRKDDKRGLASADQSTRKRVAEMGGSAFHAKRGAKGSDSPKS